MSHKVQKEEGILEPDRTLEGHLVESHTHFETACFLTTLDEQAEVH